jgi:hypothetical protein
MKRLSNNWKKICFILITLNLLCLPIPPNMNTANATTQWNVEEGDFFWYEWYGYQAWSELDFFDSLISFSLSYIDVTLDSNLSQFLFFSDYVKQLLLDSIYANFTAGLFNLLEGALLVNDTSISTFNYTVLSKTPCLNLNVSTHLDGESPQYNINVCQNDTWTFIPSTPPWMYTRSDWLNASNIFEALYNHDRDQNLAANHTVLGMAFSTGYEYIAIDNDSNYVQVFKLQYSSTGILKYWNLTTIEPGYLYQSSLTWMNPTNEDSIPGFQLPTLGILFLLIVTVSIFIRKNTGKFPQMK